MTVSAGVAGALELTDDEARKVLEMMGQKPTDASIRAMRDQMASAQQFLKSVKSTYRIETHREIKTNDPMSPADFR